MKMFRFFALVVSMVAITCGSGCRRDTAAHVSIATTNTPTASVSKDAKPAASILIDAQPHADDEIVLCVNTNRLTWKELKFGVDIHFTRMRGSLGLMGQQQQRTYRNDLYKNICRSYVYQYLILDEARRLGLSLSSEEKATAVEAAKKMAKAAGLTPEALRQTIPCPGFFELQAEQVLLVAKLEKQEITDKIKISDSDVAQRLADLQKTTVEREKTTAEKKRRIEEIHRQLKAGGDFAALAKTNSECPSASKGGVLGTYTREEIQDLAIRAAAFALKTGEISDVLKTGDGFLVLKAIKATPATRDAEEKLLAPATVELAQILLMTEDPETIPSPEELAANLRKSGLRQGKMMLLKRLQAAAKISCPLFTDLNFR